MHSLGSGGIIRVHRVNEEGSYIWNKAVDTIIFVVLAILCAYYPKNNGRRLTVQRGSQSKSCICLLLTYIGNVLQETRTGGKRT